MVDVAAPKFSDLSLLQNEDMQNRFYIEIILRLSRKEKYNYNYSIFLLDKKLFYLILI